MTSVFGAIFAPDQRAVARELFRVSRRGGRVGMANWTPGGFSSGLADIVARYATRPGEGAPKPYDWGDEQKVESLFAGLAEAIDIAVRAVRFEWRSMDAMRKVFEAHGIAAFAKQTLRPERYEAMMGEIEDLVRRHSDAADDAVAFDVEYLLVVARKGRA